MKKNKRILLMLLSMALIIAVLYGCNKPVDSKNGDVTKDTTPTEEVAVIESTVVKVDAANKIASPADNAKTDVAPLKAWWANWPIFTNNGSAAGVDDVLAEGSTAMEGLYDDGTGPYFRASRDAGVKSNVSMYATWGFKKQAWIEGSGDARNVIGAMNKLADGTYEMDSFSGAARMVAHYWSWWNAGPSKSKEANEVNWMGMPAYVNNEAFMGKLGIDPNEVPLPTYPDGRVATGYIDNVKSPVNAVLYDACGSKDLNGNFLDPNNIFTDGTNPDDKIYWTDELGRQYKAGDFSVGKDEAAPYWVGYNRKAARELMAQGTDGFWVDNYIGWDSMSNRPLTKGFGEWSKDGTVKFINANPQLGVKGLKKGEDLVKYIKNKFLDINPAGDPDKLDFDTAWQSPDWMADPVWRAYLTFKSNSMNQAGHNIYNAIKEEATKLGKNPDDISVTGNDFCLMQYGAIDGQSLDLVSTEYGPDFNVVTGFDYDGLPPFGRPTGIYSILGQAAKGKHASVWYYPHMESASKIMGLAVGYHALSHNILINSGSSSNIVGTSASARDVNKAVGKLKGTFANREKYAEVALLYSSESEMLQLAPGGWQQEGKMECSLGYLSWAFAMDELGIPFRATTDFNLEKVLNEVNVLILPGTVAISKDMVDVKLKAFLDAGKTIIVVGADSGMYDTKAGIFQPHGSSLLVDMSKNYKGAGKVLYFDTTPSLDAYKYHQKCDTLAEVMLDLKSTADIFDGLYADGKMNKLIEKTGFGDFVYTTLNYDPYTNIFFVDIANMNIDVAADTVKPTAGTIKVRIPEKLVGMDIGVSIFQNNDKVFKVPTKVTVNGGYLEVEIPQFDMYTTIIIKAK